MKDQSFLKLEALGSSSLHLCIGELSGCLYNDSKLAGSQCSYSEVFRMAVRIKTPRTLRRRVTVNLAGLLRMSTGRNDASRPNIVPSEVELVRTAAADE